jgi:membrane protein YdbS with pleckstrin-like domain
VLDASLHILLAQTYRPFYTPLPIYDYWYWLLLPLCLLFSIVYKAVKCESVKQVPRQALSITIWILLGMAAAAAVLTILVKWRAWG